MDWQILIQSAAQWASSEPFILSSIVGFLALWLRLRHRSRDRQAQLDTAFLLAVLRSGNVEVRLGGKDRIIVDGCNCNTALPVEYRTQASRKNAEQEQDASVSVLRAQPSMMLDDTPR
jgi:hypothetical protein